MGGNTEPIIAVIGHPIAGNPAQFAIERALQALDLEWRVFSFDVSGDDLYRALDGLEVLGVRGVLIDATLAPAAGRWRVESNEAEQGGETTAPGPYVDCLIRDADHNVFRKHSAAAAWFQSLLHQHVEQLEHEIQKTIVIGDRESPAPWWDDDLASTFSKLPRNRQRIEEADLIVIGRADQELDDLEVEDWPDNDGSILVVDFSHAHPDLTAIRSRGYRVVGSECLRIGTLTECFRSWTSQDAPRETIHDAIEEYLAV